MDKELQKDLQTARKFVLETMLKVRDGKIEVNRADVVNKGAREMVMIGKLELEVEKITKDE